MTEGWQTRKSWADARMPHIKAILGAWLITEAPFEEDARHCTDLMVLRLEAVRIAVRLRRHTYETEYGNEFTIRSSGAISELERIVSGWGDFFFYGFENPDDPRGVGRCFLGDLKVFRLWYSQQLLHGKQPWRQMSNWGEGDSDFHAFRIDDLPREFIIRRYPKAG